MNGWDLCFHRNLTPPHTHRNTKAPGCHVFDWHISDSVCSAKFRPVCVCEGIFPGFWTPSDWHKWVRDRPPYRSKHVYVFLCSSYSSPTPPQLILRVIFFLNFPTCLGRGSDTILFPPQCRADRGSWRSGGLRTKGGAIAHSSSSFACRV